MEIVQNVGDYISNNLNKIKGFDFRWNSLITSNPLLFEDINYLRIKSFIDNQITNEELEAYKRGDLRDLYATLDNLLVCNLKYYDRIINYCTMVFLHYIEIDGNIHKDKQAKLDMIPYELSLTPTKIWCAVLANQNSTKWEIEYGWNVRNLPTKTKDKSIFELSWNILYKNKTFAKFNEWNAFRCNSHGFRETFLLDKTSNRKLAQVCNKFTNSSIAISEQQLDNIFEYYKQSEIINNKLYIILDKCLLKLFNGDKSQYSIYIFNSEFFIFTSKFSIKVSKSSKGIITKDYLANSYECFAAEEFLIPSIKIQIEWAKYNLPQIYEYDKKILKSILHGMLKNNYREIICIKRTNEIGILSKITFTGIFAMVKINEVFMIDNRIIKSITKTLSKENAAKYIVDRGYTLFGTEKDITELIVINKKTLINHYNNYCVPVLQHMFDIITLHNIFKNDIIDVMVSGTISKHKLNNHNIKYSIIKQFDKKQILSKGLDYQNKKILSAKKGYWKVIED